MDRDLVLKSNATAGTVLGLAGLAAGALLVKLSAGVPDRNASAAFMLGLLLLGISLLAVLIKESRVVTISPGRRFIRLDIRHRWGARTVKTPFSAIERIGIVRLGSTSNGSVYYDLALIQKDGTELCLFGGCPFEGRMNRSRIEETRAHLQALIEANR